MTDDNGVTISATQMYSELQSVHLKLAEIAASLENLSGKLADQETRIRGIENANGVEQRVGEQETKLASVGEKTNDHEMRLRTIEQWRWKFAGAILVLSVVASALVGAGVRYLTGG